MKLTDIITQAGLNEREAQAYLALLELGEATISQISHRSGIERTYCYDIVEALVKKNLASAVPKNGRRRYQAANPETLARLLEDRLAAVRAGLSQLEAHHNLGDKRPVVEFYEGKVAVFDLYQELMDTDEYAAIVSPAALYEAIGDQLDGMAIRVVARGTRVRELISTEDGLPAYVKRFKTPQQEVRLLPTDVKIATDTLIFNNKVVSIAYTPKPHAIVTEGSDIVETQRALFEFMWQSASSDHSQTTRT